MRGLILTHAYTLMQFITAVQRARMDAAKFVTAWGLAGGWDHAARVFALSAFKHNIVRTVSGDPSYQSNSERFKYPRALETSVELAPWDAAAREVGKSFWIELGNEPNTHIQSEQEIWVFRYFLEDTIKQLRRDFPEYKLIAPALILGKNDQGKDYNQARFLEICADVFLKCDAVGVHLYEHDAYVQKEQRHGSTGQLVEAIKLYSQYTPGAPLIISEYGINDPATPLTVKGSRYAQFAKSSVFRNPVLGSFVYHFCADEEVHPQYHFSRLGQDAFSVAL